MYEETISALKNLKSIAAHIASLGKIMNKTEDPQLQKLLPEVIMELQCTHIHLDFKYKSTSLNLINGRGNVIRELIDYCMTFITAKKPEWQVSAERHGWAPKQNDTDA
ncbi:hypothetical protein [Acinetobacter indicus]|uniref:hypothetical protein n=1 Tax=Acinetobacter indicus TaxID=756892 RepID=UPI0014447CB6|nr:hypothetical protein [Acinetobacter indicus]